MIEGDLPNRATKMVVEWASMYQQELLKPILRTSL
ncbi:MAG: hypothetical protein ACKPH1_20590 [Microcystis panniformis]